MYDVRRMQNCSNENIYVFTVEGLEAAQLVDCLSDLGTVRQPLPDADLFKIDESGFVVTGNADAGRFRLRIKTTGEATATKRRVERRLERCRQPSDRR